MVTVSWNNVQDNRTMLAAPGQFCRTICIIHSLRDAVLNSMMAETLIIGYLAALLFSYATVYRMSFAEVFFSIALIVIYSLDHG